MKKLKSSGLTPIIIILIIVGILAVVAAVVAGGYLAVGYFVAVPKSPVESTSTTLTFADITSPPPTTPVTGDEPIAAPLTVSTTSAPANPVPVKTACDNYQCLIAAASRCQPIAAAISYSGTPVPLPLHSHISASGQIEYEIKKSSGVNDCLLTISSLANVFSISDAGRRASLASGMTDAQITAQLQTMNDSLKSMAGVQTICPSQASIISAYLTDTAAYYEKKSGNINVESNGQTTTYTTSSGQKLACTLALPAGQPAS